MMKRWILLWGVSILLIGCTAQSAREETETAVSLALVTRAPVTSSLTISPTLASIQTVPPVPQTAVLPTHTAVPPATVAPTPSPTALPLPPPIPTVPPAATNVRTQEDAIYDFRQWSTFDGIPPIYEPQFVAAEGAPLQDDELVMGVTLGGEAKAYPITILQFREIVNDEFAGIPILVTW
ncbi:hypothetical protein MNBD_CHLOROFLEXI01-5141 [hydrothermal vent metagenome]|uniref:DUF3179 domain-containing protein n=1 Tax=hydrothermal vent metagenome TaxID=652676 RepID=A0A3B0UTV5_9ZZZZ